MEFSNIIPLLHSCVFILCYLIDYFSCVGLCEYVCLYALACMRACMHVHVDV